MRSFKSTIVCGFVSAVQTVYVCFSVSITSIDDHPTRPMFTFSLRVGLFHFARYLLEPRTTMMREVWTWIMTWRI